jgi:hypothetical protein
MRWRKGRMYEFARTCDPDVLSRVQTSRPLTKTVELFYMLSSLKCESNSRMMNWIWWTVCVFTWITRSGAGADVEMRFIWSTRVQLQGVWLPIAALLLLATGALLYHGYLLDSLQRAYPLHARPGGQAGRFHGTGLQIWTNTHFFRAMIKLLSPDISWNLNVIRDFNE